MDPMSDEELEAGLRRVLADPARRLPDSLVPLERVHAGARRRKARRQAITAAAGASTLLAAVVVFAGIGHLAGRTRTPASGGSATGVVSSQDLQSPTAGSQPAKPIVPSASIRPVPAGFTPISVTAISPQRWWVLGKAGGLATTTDGGQSW